MEEADLEAARDLFGGDGGPVVNPDTLAPKTAKDFEEFALAVAVKYLQPHARSQHYKVLCKVFGPLGILSFNLDPSY